MKGIGQPIALVQWVEDPKFTRRITVCLPP